MTKPIGFDTPDDDDELEPEPQVGELGRHENSDAHTRAFVAVCKELVPMGASLVRVGDMEARFSRSPELARGKAVADADEG